MMFSTDKDILSASPLKKVRLIDADHTGIARAVSKPILSYINIKIGFYIPSFGNRKITKRTIRMI